MAAPKAPKTIPTATTDDHRPATTYTIEPATGARFPDVATIIGPKNPGAQGCWYLAYLVGHSVESKLKGADRADHMETLCRRRGHGPGVLASAKGKCAPAVDAYPVDNKGSKVDRTLASVGTVAMYERAGLRVLRSVAGKRDGFPQVVMRRDL